MNRKLALIVAAIVLPGGFIALLGVMFLKALSQTERGRKVVALAQKRVSRLTLGPTPSAENQIA
ncbi:MAG: hypothetical protein E6J86_05200 [Deltaproteobacteria bacterium]|nr:MAG: hypothetical protein E6J86_05200 [Deltaproteobacteria bacterium]